MDWVKIEIPEEPDIEDSKGFLDYQHNWYIAKQKMENLLEVMAQEISSSKADKNKKPIKRQETDNKRVFIVHGTDYEPVKQLKAILQEVEIKPIILHEQPSKGMTIIEKLETYSNVGFAFIFLTPDDNGFGKEEFTNFLNNFLNKNITSEKELNAYLNNLDEGTAYSLIQKTFTMIKNRARQNVVLEFGYFIGKLGRRKVCCLFKGDIELPSDMQGICYLHFNNSVNEVKEAIIEELKAADYKILS
jgi:predicted nucleotide-binding protein